MAVGRKRKPTKLKKLHGETDKRRLNEHEPEPPEGHPPMPTTLDEVGKAKWADLCHTLSIFGLLNKVAHHSIELYCHTYSNYLVCLDACQRYGYVFAEKSERGTDLKRSAYAIELHQARKELMSLQAEWGLTPSSASRLVVPGAKELTDFEKLLQ